MKKLLNDEASAQLVIGRNPVLEALKFNPRSIKKILITQGLIDKKIKQIEKEAKQKNIPIEILPKALFQELFDKSNKSEGISQGIAAFTEEFKYYDITEFINNKPRCTILLLDEIQDPHNLGAIARTAAASGIDGILITEKNSAKINHTVIKASSGAVNRIKIGLSGNIYQTIELFKNAEFTVIGSDSGGKTQLYEYNFPDKCLIIFGNEGEGIRKNVLKLCDIILNIPISGKVESLNVSVSAGIVLYELFRQKNY